MALNIEKLADAMHEYVHETRRPNPCNGCERNATCDVNETDCFAFRRWTNEGDYNDRQIGRLLRPFERL